jgi:tRNA dimethylallyltransferase
VNTKFPLIDGKRPRVALIAGPTASGKSDLALALAKLLPATIINADASQVYSDLRIMSARPSIADEAAAPHRLFGHIDGAQACSAADWAHEAKAAMAQALEDGRLPILVGGTGLYLRTLLDGIAPVPEIDLDIRAEVRRLDISLAYDALLREDADAAMRLAPSDRARIARALEVVRSTGRRLKYWQESRLGGVGDAIEIVPLILLPPRGWLYARCDMRFTKMLERGGVDEVKALLARQLDPALPVMRAIGVREVTAIIADPTATAEQAMLAQIATRQYAKRQFTWFRNQFSPEWPRAECEINNDIVDQLAIKLRKKALT